ncbi:hypothetical protein GCM10020256_01870 [Streptomyces thermocoprophilus]
MRRARAAGARPSAGSRLRSVLPVAAAVRSGGEQQPGHHTVGQCCGGRLVESRALRVLPDPTVEVRELFPGERRNLRLRRRCRAAAAEKACVPPR